MNWKQRVITDKTIGDIIQRIDNRLSCFSVMLIHNTDVFPTFTRQDRTILYEEYRSVNKEEACLVQTFPTDYNFTKNQWGYLIGMSVPPLMIARLADEIYKQWLSKI